LLETLTEKEVISQQIQDRLNSQQNIIDQIKNTRDSYRKVARRGSTLFFALNQMNLIDPMYVWSLELFVQLYKRTIFDTPKLGTQDQRTRALIHQLTQKINQNVSQGLFSKDIIFFSLNLCIKILLADEKIQLRDWDLFLRDSQL